MTDVYLESGQGGPAHSHGVLDTHSWCIVGDVKPDTSRSSMDDPPRDPGRRPVLAHLPRNVYDPLKPWRRRNRSGDTCRQGHTPRGCKEGVEFIRLLLDRFDELL